MNYPPISEHFDRKTITGWTFDAIDKLIALVDDLETDQLIGPYSRQLNPSLWEMTHALWFLERWTLRDLLSRPPYFEDVDHIYDSTRIRHGKRWVEEMIPLPEIKDYSDHLKETLDEAIPAQWENEKFLYRLLYAVYHADMHTEALTFQRQSRALPPPQWLEMSDVSSADVPEDTSIHEETIGVSGGTFQLGASPEEYFCFDNEKWEHEVQVKPFRMDRTPVTEGQFREFVEAGGYENYEYWSQDGEEWLKSRGLNAPIYWEQRNGQWEKRFFDRWKPLDSLKPMVHVSQYEAKAYCRWAGRRLPTEAEWAFVARSAGEGSGEGKSLYPWGDEFPTPEKANLDWKPPARSPVTAHEEGETREGFRQLIGNVWEWTSTCFEPFEDFEADFYEQYSQPWFGSRYVLRGGSWSTRSRLIRSGFRNFYTPDRNDRYLGFRTCERTD